MAPRLQREVDKGIDELFMDRDRGSRGWQKFLPWQSAKDIAFFQKCVLFRTSFSYSIVYVDAEKKEEAVIIYVQL